MALETRPWDVAEILETREDIAAYLDAVLEYGDPELLKTALGDITRAKGMTEIARAAGLGRVRRAARRRPTVSTCSRPALTSVRPSTTRWTRQTPSGDQVPHGASEAFAQRPGTSDRHTETRPLSRFVNANAIVHEALGKLEKRFG